MNQVFRDLDDPEFNRFFTDFRFTAYRLETRQHYDVSYEKGEFELFLKGQDRGEFPGISRWVEDVVEPARAAGKRMSRVHVVEEPLSDYVRFECAWAYTHTAAAGEDVRIIPVPAGEWPFDVPRWDYWLFDGSIVIKMHYTDGGAFEAAEVVNDPTEVFKASFRESLALLQSTPFAKFWADRQ